MEHAHATCPACGENLQATVKVYLTNVVVTDGKITSSDVQSESIGAQLDLYCANDHTDIEGVLIEDGHYPTEVTLYGVTLRTD